MVNEDILSSPLTSPREKSLQYHDAVIGTFIGPYTYSGMSDASTGEWMESFSHLVGNPETIETSRLTDSNPTSLVDFGLKL